MEVFKIMLNKWQAQGNSGWTFNVTSLIEKFYIQISFLNLATDVKGIWLKKRKEKGFHTKNNNDAHWEAGKGWKDCSHYD